MSFDFGNALTIDEENNIITAGTTYASAFYVVNPIQDYINGESDGYICKFNLTAVTITAKGSIEMPISILLLISTLTIFSIRKRRRN